MARIYHSTCRFKLCSMVTIHVNGPDASTSPLETVAGAAGPEAAQAFKRLANEKRLAILVALWEIDEPFEEDDAVPFSVLRKHVGMRDKGQFNYHLDLLTGHFVEQTDEGYKLRRAGHQLVQTVIAGTGLKDHSFGPTEIDRDCYLCGAPTLVTYDDDWLYWVCTQCDGLFHSDGVPEGALAGVAFDPAGFVGRNPEAVLNAAWTGVNYQSPLGGVCDACSGPMDSWLHLCDEHATEGRCPNCGWRDAAVARFRCTVCKWHFQVAPWWLVIGHPAVIAFYYDRGVPLQFEDGVYYQPRIESDLQTHHEQELVSVDPPRVRVTIQYTDDELRLTLDEGLNVVDVS